MREMFNEQDTRDSELAHVECLRDAETYLGEHAVDLILLDLALPDAHGLEAIRRVHAAAPRVPLVVLTGIDDEMLAAQALQEGAQDYLIKGQIDTRSLLRAMRYAKERKRLEWLKDEFVATVSHELRTPLTSISGSLGLLVGKSAPTLPPPAGRLVEIAHRNCQRLVRLVNDILDIAKMDSGCVFFDFKRIEVRALVEEVVEANRGFAENHGVRIRFADSPVVNEVRADPDRLAQVVTNLLSNAIKFSPVDNEVVVMLENGADVVRLSVLDHGSGISADFKPHLFERFAQADAGNARQNGGTGLGLSIVKQIIDRFDGKVVFSDTAGGGTTVNIELPHWERAGATINLAAHPNALRILLCEADIPTTFALGAQLKQAGFAADFTNSADDAISIAKTAQYHAVLVGQSLPKGEDISLIQRLRKLPQYCETPIIVVSADFNGRLEDPRLSKLNVLHSLKQPLVIDRLVRVLAEHGVHHVNSHRRISENDDLAVGADGCGEDEQKLTVLLVERNPGDARLLHEVSNEEGVQETDLTIVAGTPARFF